MFDDDNMNVSDGDDNGKSPAIENTIATSTTKRSKKQSHSGGSPLTGLPNIRSKHDFLHPQFLNLLWTKDWITL